MHYSDAVEEKISLSDRFGLSLAFYPQSALTYLGIVDSYFPDALNTREGLHKAALDFAHQRASKSGRMAKQFYNTFVNRSLLKNCIPGILRPEAKVPV